MKNFILLSLLTLTTAISASETKTILNCHEKFSDLTITKNGDQFEIERDVLLNRVKGTPYLRGGISSASSGVIYAKSVKASSNKLSFTLEEGLTLDFKIVNDPEKEIQKIEIETNVEYVLDQLNTILGVSENALVFDSLDACSINL